MLSTMESRWRFVIAGLLGLAVGLVTGTAAATIYVGLRLGESPATLDPLRPWFLAHPEALRLPPVRNLALLITGLVTFATLALGLGARHRGRAARPADGAMGRRPMVS